MKKSVFFVTLFLVSAVVLTSYANEVRITPNSGYFEVDGDLDKAVHGWATSTADVANYGGYFRADGGIGKGVYGEASGYAGKGVQGYATGSDGWGVYGSATGSSGTGALGYASGVSGKGVHGFATYSGNATNWGGYFTAAAYSGRGVYGFATYSGNATNYGGYFTAAAYSGRGVYGAATGVYGKGVYGSADGSAGMGVYGSATYSGNATNYGGYFEASAYRGIGVYGSANYPSNLTTYGGLFVAVSSNGTGVCGRADSGSAATGVAGYGSKYDFYAGGAGTNYGPFTGAHEVKFAHGIQEEIAPGIIVSLTGKTERRRREDGSTSLSSTLPTVKVSAKPKDKAVFGVIVSDGPLPEGHWYKGDGQDHFGVVNALGEGRVWVTNRNGEIEAGDYITTSDISGHGQLQDDDLLHSYTLGKAIETVDWEQVSETTEYDGKTYKRYLIAVVYTSG